MNPEVHALLEAAIRQDGRYPPEAFEFLQRGLELTAQRIHGDPDENRPRHVSGQELARGLRDLALQSWGRLARDVLSRWNIRRTRDFGEMVFFLIELGLMSKRDSDRIEDFDDVFDFDAAFADYSIPLTPPTSSIGDTA